MTCLVFYYTTSAEGVVNAIPFVVVPLAKEYPMAAKTKTPRLDQTGGHRKQYQVNKKKIYATQSICGICGKPVDMSLEYPHPLSACIDHIIPVAKGGHPSDINNLQLAHWTCNRAKSDKLVGTKEDFEDRREKAKVVGNRNLPLSVDCKNF